jgi:hypothetical protein
VSIRKLMLAIALAVVLVPLFAAVALAAEGQLIQCRNVLPCYGSNGDDKILERIGDEKDDRIIARGGRDLVLANKYTADEDVVSGGGGDDRINVADGDKLDTANGGKGRDRCIVDARREAGTSYTSVDVQRPQRLGVLSSAVGRDLERLPATLRDTSSEPNFLDE